VWTSPTYGPSKNDLFAQICAGGNFTPPSYATNYASPAFVGDTSSGGGSSGGSVGSVLPYPYVAPPTLGVPGEVVSGGSVNPTPTFALAAGTYNGLFYNLSGVSPVGAGSVSVTVATNRSFSGSVSIGPNQTYGFPKGSLFDPLGAATVSVSRGKVLSSLTVSLQLDLAGGSQIHGTVKSGNEWAATLFAAHQIDSPAPYAGTYTLVVPAGQGGPPGTGYGTVTINPNPKVKSVAVCQLADGTKLTLAPPTLSKTGLWPLYYNVPGEFLMGWIQFNINPPGNDSGGDLVWIKPALKSAKLYPAGFTSEVSATAALNLPVAQGTRQLHLSGGGLNQAMDYPVQVGANNKVTSLSANVQITSSSATAFTAKATVPSVGKPITVLIYGTLLKDGEGAGFFMNGSQSGQVKLDQP